MTLILINAKMYVIILAQCFWYDFKDFNGGWINFSEDGGLYSEFVAAKNVKNLERDCWVDYDFPVKVQEVDALFGHVFLLIVIIYMDFIVFWIDFINSMAKNILSNLIQKHIDIFQPSKLKGLFLSIEGEFFKSVFFLFSFLFFLFKDLFIRSKLYSESYS